MMKGYYLYTEQLLHIHPLHCCTKYHLLSPVLDCSQSSLFPLRVVDHMYLHAAASTAGFILWLTYRRTVPSYLFFLICFHSCRGLLQLQAEEDAAVSKACLHQEFCLILNIQKFKETIVNMLYYWITYIFKSILKNTPYLCPWHCSSHRERESLFISPPWPPPGWFSSAKHYINISFQGGTRGCRM